MDNAPHTLPVPSKPYGLWSRFVTDLYEHGKRHAIRAIVQEEMERILPDVVSSYEQVPRPPMVRPSGNLHCARAAYLLTKYGTEQEMDPGLGASFSAGHFFHALAFAYCRSAVPQGFELVTEEVADLSALTWWPADPQFRQTGSRDMVLRIEDEELAAKYLVKGAGTSALVDFKTMGRWAYGKHRNSDPWEGPDGFGYMSQLAVYSDGGELYDEVVLSGINRDQLAQPLKSRVIPSQVLRKERDRIVKGFRLLAKEQDPGCEFFLKWGKQADFTCGPPDKKEGTCRQSANCGREGWAV